MFMLCVCTGELQSWLDLCRQDPALQSYLLSSGGLQQLPTDLSGLPPHQVDALRETVAVAQANKGGAGLGPSRSRQQGAADSGVVGEGGGEEGRSATSDDSWLQDFTELNVVGVTPLTLCGLANITHSEWLADLTALHSSQPPSRAGVC